MEDSAASANDNVALSRQPAAAQEPDNDKLVPSRALRAQAIQDALDSGIQDPELRRLASRLRSKPERGPDLSDEPEEGDEGDEPIEYVPLQRVQPVGYNFTNDYQDLLLACLIRYPDEFRAYGDIIKPEYFSGASACETALRLLEYQKKYGEFPNFSVLGNFAFHKAKRVNIDHANDCLDYVTKLAKLDTRDRKGVLDMALDYARERALYDALKTIHSATIEGKRDKIDPRKLIEEALSVGSLGAKYAAIDLSEFAKLPINEDDTLLGNRFLCRGGGCLVVGSTGLGKSSTVVQAAQAWAAGREMFGIRPKRKLRILIVQVENDKGDMHEMTEALPDDRNGDGTFCKVIHCNDQCGDNILGLLRQWVKMYKPDLVILDPLQSYLGTDPSDAEAVIKFCNQGLNPILTEFKLGIIINCHTPKTRQWDTSKWKPGDWAHAAAGYSGLSNWARAILVIDPTHDPRVYKFVAAKRRFRLAWVDEIGKPTFIKYFAHEEDKILWREAMPSEIARAEKAEHAAKGGRPTENSDSTLLKPLVGLEDGLPLAGLHKALTGTKCDLTKSALWKRMAKLIVDGKVRKEGENYVLGAFPKRLGNREGLETHETTANID